MNKEEKIQLKKEDSNIKIDEKLYNRQLYVLGHEAMKRMAESNVLIVGLNGLGLEIGVKSVTLYDQKKFTMMDFSSHFYAESKLGENRAEISLEKLRELNPYCNVYAETKSKLDKEYLLDKSFKVVVFCDDFITDLVEINKTCRDLGIKFIATESRGLCGSIFVDCGKKFEILDSDGENIVTTLISSISNSNPGVVTVDEEHRHGLYTGDKVVFEGIEGMDELNNITPMPITSTGLYTFTICDTSYFKSYNRGGYVTQVKEKIIKDYSSLENALKNPTFVSDFGKDKRPKNLHYSFLSLSKFYYQHGRYPKPYNKEDSKEMINIALDLSKGENIDTKIVELFSFTCQGNLIYMASFLGGVVAQEVQKACSGKFSPIDNFLYFDSFESLKDLPSEDQCKPLNSRYDGQIIVFGRNFQEKLSKQNVFIVGSGALGCEYLKIFSMMGISEKGTCYITDMDLIEISNLNRQFLFRQKHVGKLKSETAANSAKQMNPNFNVKYLSEKVAPETESVFDDSFWESLDFVCNALDNVQARLYVDSRCIYFRKPLIESGTLGTKCNTQVVIPFLTESYGSSRDPPEKEIPICTLKNFPNQIEHTIQYARDLFESFFKQGSIEVNNYLEGEKAFIQHLDEQGQNKLGTVKNIYENLVLLKPESFDDCVKWSRFKFEELFHNQILQLLFNFPEDMVTQNKTPFWFGSKKPPKPVEFDSNNEIHLSFIISSSILRANNYLIQIPKDYNFKKAVDNVKVPKFEPKSGVKIATTKEEAEQMVPDEDKEAKELLSKLPESINVKTFLKPIDFEKDDDTNYHIEFITSASNLRAINYKIPIADKHKTKGIAGKIIPAMVTTTSLTCGMSTFEILKIVNGSTNLEDYKNTFINIGVGIFQQSTPIEPLKQKYLGKEYSLWDRFDINLGRDLTLKEFLDHFQNIYKLEISMMSCGSAVIYNSFTPKNKLEKRLKTPLSKLVEEISLKKLTPPQKYLSFTVVCSDKNGDTIDEIPEIRYKFK